MRTCRPEGCKGLRGAHGLDRIPESAKPSGIHPRCCLAVSASTPGPPGDTAGPARQDDGVAGHACLGPSKLTHASPVSLAPTVAGTDSSAFTRLLAPVTLV